MFDKFVPDMYQKSVYTIDYKKLKKMGIKCILFGLNNTLIPTSVNKPDKRLKMLFYELKKMGFKLIILSNSPKSRVEIFKDVLQVDSAAFSFKPRKDKYLKIINNYGFKSTEIVSIGDKFVTDIYGANRMNITSILVNSMSEQDFFISKFNKLFERFIFKFLIGKGLFVRGKYYE